MAAMAWSDDLRIGSPVIDEQHESLADLLTSAHAAFQAGEVDQALGRLRDFLRDFAAHFAEEQQVLARAGSDQVAARDRDWRNAHFLFAAHPLEADDVEVIGQLLNAAGAWLTDHIIRQDEPVRALLAQAPARRRLRFDMVKLRWRIALLALVPLAALAALGLAYGVDLQRNAASMRLMARMNLLNGEVGDVIHELQHERGLATLVLHDRRLGRDMLSAQIRRTQAAAAALRATASGIEGELPPGPVRARLEGALLSLELVDEVRGDIASGSFDAVETMDFYTTAIEDLAAVVPDVVRSFLPSDFAKLTFAQVFLQQAKERAGQERTAGVAVLSSAAPEQHANASVRDLAAEQRALGAGFVALAPSELGNAYRAAERTEEGPRNWMRVRLEAGDLTQLSAGEWFEVSSRYIDALRAVETQVNARLQAEAARLERQTQRRFLMLGGGMVGLGLVSLAMVLSLGWSTLPPLVRLAGAVRRLANGERTVAIPGLDARDELGAVARSVQQLKQRLVHGDLLEARRLTTNAERLRVVADNTPGIVFRVFQPDQGRAVLVCTSRKLKDITGLSPAEVVDAPLRRLLARLVEPTDRAGLLRLLHRPEPSPLSFEFRLRRSHPGLPRWLRVVVSPSPTEGGWLWDGVALDVTALKAAERERRAIADHLARLGPLDPPPKPEKAGTVVPFKKG